MTCRLEKERGIEERERKEGYEGRSEKERQACKSRGESYS